MEGDSMMLQPGQTIRLSVVRPVTEEELTEAWTKFDRVWGEVVETLYRLCREVPDEDTCRHTMAKVILINRAYNARLEAQLRPSGASKALDLVCEFVDDHGQAMREIVAAVPDVEVLIPRILDAALRGHAEMMQLLAVNLTKHAEMRSFVSKYLHFHRPIVPIFDELCQKNLHRRVLGRITNVPEWADPKYYDFCLRFLALSEDARSRGLPITVKKLDAVLWQPIATAD
jgi:hypothetical protein